MAACGYIIGCCGHVDRCLAGRVSSCSLGDRGEGGGLSSVAGDVSALRESLKLSGRQRILRGVGGVLDDFGSSLGARCGLRGSSLLSGCVGGVSTLSGGSSSRSVGRGTGVFDSRVVRSTARG